MRNLRAIYNQAVEQGFTPQCHPFARVYTGIAKTVKRAVNIDEILKIKAYRLPPHSIEDFSRDIFLFSFYTCGMSLTDIANLKKSDLQNQHPLCCLSDPLGHVVHFHHRSCHEHSHQTH